MYIEHNPLLRSYSKHITAYIHVATYRRTVETTILHPSFSSQVRLLACWRALGHCRGRANPAMHVARNGRVSGNRKWCTKHLFDGKVRAGTLWLRSAQRRPLAGAKNSGESQREQHPLCVQCECRAEVLHGHKGFSRGRVSCEGVTFRRRCG